MSLQRNRNVRLEVERLEDRQLLAGMSVRAGLGGNLYINGTNSADYAHVFRTEDGIGVKYRSAGEARWSYKYFEGGKQFNEIYGRIFFNGYGGKDLLNVNADLPVVAHGGPGNDVLSGGTMNDKLYGDGDNDWLLGQAGDDTLQGGRGYDSLLGGTADDVLWGGQIESDYLNGGYVPAQSNTIYTYDYFRDILYVKRNDQFAVEPNYDSAFWVPYNW